MSAANEPDAPMGERWYREAWVLTLQRAEELEAEVRGMRSEVQHARANFAHAEIERDAAQAALRTTREALAFYADPLTYEEFGNGLTHSDVPIDDDRGKRARMVLEPPQAPNEQPAP